MSTVIPFLLLGVGTLLVVFQPWKLTSDQELGSGETDVEQSQFEAETTAITENVTLEPGWTAPELSLPQFRHQLAIGLGDQDNNQDASGSEGGNDLQFLASGTPTMGARVGLPSGESKSVILRGLGGARLAFRSFKLGAWTSWELLESSPVEGPDGEPGSEGSTVGNGNSVDAVGPQWFASDVKALEVMVVGGPAPSELVAVILPSGGVTQADPAPVDPAPAGPSTDAGGELEVIGRAQWASSGWDYGNEDCDNGPLIADSVAAIVIHHTVTENTYESDDVPSLLRAIYYLHVEINGWCDIGYNFVVDRFGRVWEARTGSAQDPVIGGHSKGFNTGTVGIAMLGQFQEGLEPIPSAPSTTMTNAVAQLAEVTLANHGIDPVGKTWLRNRSDADPQKLTGESWHHVPTVLAHQDLGVTSCPGDHSLPWLRSIASSINSRREIQPPYQTSDWTPKENGPGFVVADQRGGLRAAGSAEGIMEVANRAAEDPTLGSKVLAVQGVGQSGYVLTSQWALISYGDAPPLVVPRHGSEPPIDIVLRSDARSGWVLDRVGNLFGFGGLDDISATRPTDDAVAVDVNDKGTGYVLSSDGTISAIGGATPIETKAAGSTAVDIAIREGLDGRVAGWVIAKDGTITSFSNDSSVQPQISKIKSEDGARPEVVRAIASANGLESGGWVLDANGQLWPFGGARHITPFYGDSSKSDAVDLAEVGTILSPTFLQSDRAVYVSALYLLFQGRAAAPEEVDLAVSALEEGTDRSDLAERLARADHWAGNEIEHMYLDVLGRTPDEAGRKYWVDQVRDGLQYQELGLYFYGSDEYVRRSGSNGGFVRRLYSDLLGREPEAEGFSYWVDLLDSGAAEPTVITENFYASVESRTARSRRLYRTILGVDLAAEDRQEWADKLLEIDDLTLAAEIAGSGDYYDLVVLEQTP